MKKPHENSTFCDTLYKNLAIIIKAKKLKRKRILSQYRGVKISRLSTKYYSSVRSFYRLEHQFSDFRKNPDIA